MFSVFAYVHQSYLDLQAGLVRPDPELPDDEEEQLYMVFKEANFEDSNKISDVTAGEAREDLSTAEVCS